MEGAPLEGRCKGVVCGGRRQWSCCLTSRPRRRSNMMHGATGARAPNHTRPLPARSGANARRSFPRALSCSASLPLRVLGLLLMRRRGALAGNPISHATEAETQTCSTLLPSCTQSSSRPSRCVPASTARSGRRGTARRTTMGITPRIQILMLANGHARRDQTHTHTLHLPQPS